MTYVFLAVIASGLLLFFGLPVLNVLMLHSPSPQWKHDISNLQVALEKYRVDFGEYPRGVSSEIALALTGKNSKNIVYIELKSASDEGFILDPWGRPYRFSYTETGRPLIRSLGKDGIPSDDDKIDR